MVTAILRQAASERRGESEPKLERRSAPSHLRLLCVHGANVQAVDPGRKLRPACRGVAQVSVLRTQRGCLRWQGSAPCKLRFGAFGPRLAEHLETSEASFIECPHIGRIAVIELLENVMHRYAPVIQRGIGGGGELCQITSAAEGSEGE